MSNWKGPQLLSATPWRFLTPLSEAGLVTHLVFYALFGKEGGCSKAFLDNHSISMINTTLYTRLLGVVGEGTLDV